MENTSKNFVLQLGSLVSLYVSIGAFIAVVFGVIDLAFPDPAENIWAYESAQSTIRVGIAMLIVFFPTYIVLTRMVNQIRRTEHGVYLTLTRWLIYLSLFVGGVIVLGDLVAVILSFLNGEITTRFLLKAGTLFLVVGGALYYYTLDARGYWNTRESRSKLVATVASVAVIAAIIAGFLSIDTPSEVREHRIDQQQVSDLQEMQFRIEEYYRREGALPEDFEGLFVSTTIPEAPEGRESYTYRVTGAETYELCATFALPTERGGATEPYIRPLSEVSYAPQNYSWDHEAGRVCFERIAPERQN